MSRLIDFQSILGHFAIREHLVMYYFARPQVATNVDHAQSGRTRENRQSIEEQQSEWSRPASSRTNRNNETMCHSYDT